MPETLRVADLKEDNSERPGWCTTFGAFCAQAASICLEVQGHNIDANLTIDGDYTHDFVLSREAVDDTARRFNADLQRAEEFGAYGLSALTVPRLTNLTVIEVSRKGTGFDFWMGAIDDTGPLFQRKARLEVSGILAGRESQINTRVNQKLKQISPTDHLLPGYVSVVEFGSPRIRVVQKK